MSRNPPSSPLNYPANNLEVNRIFRFDRAPTTFDFRNFRVRDFWNDSEANTLYYLSDRSGSEGTWVLLGAGSGDTETLTGNTGGAVGPDGANNINIIGANGLTIDGNPGTNTLTVNPDPAGFPITPFVVGPVGEAGYQTIQDGLDAANAAGGGVVGVQPDTYTEDLTLYPNTWVVGLTNSLQGSNVIIVGKHTPPTTTQFGFDRVQLESATHIFDSNDAGSALLYINNSGIKVTNGYMWNVPNWTGTINGNDIGDVGSTDNGVVNNSGGSIVFLNNGVYGAGTGNVMQTNGALTRLDLCQIGCSADFSAGFLDVNIAFFTETLTLSGTVLGILFNVLFATIANKCLEFSTSGNFSVFATIFDSTNNPAVDGSGSGTLELTSCTFLADDNIAGTLTLDSKTFYAGTLKTDYTEHGFLLGQGSATNVVATAAPTDGQLPIGSTGNDPVISTLTAGAGVTIVNGAGSITISSAATGLGWTDVTGTSQAMIADAGFVSDNAGLVTLTLPAVIAFGERIRVAGKGAGGWLIAQNAGQSINFGSTVTTTGAGGSLASTNAFDVVELLCVTANTQLVVLSSIGNITVV